jgi:glutaminase
MDPTPYVSTGHLPDGNRVQALVDEAHKRYLSDTSGHCSEVYPALAEVDDSLFGLCVVDTNGTR